MHAGMAAPRSSSPVTTVMKEAEAERATDDERQRGLYCATERRRFPPSLWFNGFRTSACHLLRFQSVESSLREPRVRLPARKKLLSFAIVTTESPSR